MQAAAYEISKSGRLAYRFFLLTIWSLSWQRTLLVFLRVVPFQGEFRRSSQSVPSLSSISSIQICHRRPWSTLEKLFPLSSSTRRRAARGHRGRSRQEFFLHYYYCLLTDSRNFSRKKFQRTKKIAGAACALEQRKLHPLCHSVDREVPTSGNVRWYIGRIRDNHSQD